MSATEARQEAARAHGLLKTALKSCNNNHAEEKKSELEQAAAAAAAASSDQQLFEIGEKFNEYFTFGI